MINPDGCTYNQKRHTLRRIVGLLEFYILCVPGLHIFSVKYFMQCQHFYWFVILAAFYAISEWKKNMGSIDAASYRQVNQPDQYIAPIDQSIMQMGQQATVWKQCVP